MNNPLNSLKTLHWSLCLPLLLCCQLVTAQEDPLSEDGDPLADELLGLEEETYKRIEYYGDMRLRADLVRDLPRTREPEFDRLTARVRLGAIWTATESLQFGVAAKLNLSSQNDNEVRFNLDNERADQLSLDELYLRYDISDKTAFLAGQSVFPLELSPMIWDQDLRPQGLSVQHTHDIGDFSSLELTAGFFRGNHLYSDESTITAVQAALRLGTGKKFSNEVIASYLDFSNLEELESNGLIRANSRSANNGFATDFEVLDFQYGLDMRLDNFPVSLRFDVLNNLASSNDDFAARVDLLLGNSHQAQGMELGLAAQRIEANAVVAAFNDDDWWFPTNMHGVGGWLAYGISDQMRGKMTVFHEKLDDVSTNNNRFLFDLTYSF